MVIWNLACVACTGSQRIKTGLKKAGFVHLLDLFGGRVEKEWCFSMCGVPLND